MRESPVFGGIKCGNPPYLENLLKVQILTLKGADSPCRSGDSLSPLLRGSSPPCSRWGQACLLKVQIPRVELGTRCPQLYVVILLLPATRKAIGRFPIGYREIPYYGRADWHLLLKVQILTRADSPV